MERLDAAGGVIAVTANRPLQEGEFEFSYVKGEADVEIESFSATIRLRMD